MAPPGPLVHQAQAQPHPHQLQLSSPLPPLPPQPELAKMAPPIAPNYLPGQLETAIAPPPRDRNATRLQLRLAIMAAERVPSAYQHHMPPLSIHAPLAMPLLRQPREWLPPTPTVPLWAPPQQYQSRLYAVLDSC
ncbi:hypothetical protein PCASD_18865 [Puccinia coronata f. sp. avenae]|uniref:Uncharacterized protein n=1 Tax=Puccinia coronata f. sp. avenae TaxID=200324 RepID=A0A2N5UCW8_9BASI|nr:hypothetical protein PCASD_18865 [Puccinia coronata f. sp. avenae]